MFSEFQFDCLFTHCFFDLATAPVDSIAIEEYTFSREQRVLNIQLRMNFDHIRVAFLTYFRGPTSLFHAVHDIYVWCVTARVGKRKGVAGVAEYIRCQASGSFWNTECSAVWTFAKTSHCNCMNTGRDCPTGSYSRPPSYFARSYLYGIWRINQGCVVTLNLRN